LIGALLAMALDANGVAMATELLVVFEERCRDEYRVNKEAARRLGEDLHQYDIGGLASAVGPALNSFYEEFSTEADLDLARFCASAPDLAARAGYPLLFDKP
jgi:hypothetical protein